jgi:hypothetical protein
VVLFSLVLSGGGRDSIQSRVSEMDVSGVCFELDWVSIGFFFFPRTKRGKRKE